MNDNFFKKGDKFKLTLEKVNGGYKGTCYDYQTGKTESRTYTLEDGEILTTQDAENIYVGFFAARYCDFTVENVDFYITDPDTDIVARAENIAKVTPRITISSSDFVTTTKYNLTVRPSNKSGGYVTIKQDDKVIANNAFVSKKDNVFPTTLNADGSTKFTVYYTPRYVSTEADEYEDLTSYDEVVETYIVTHKGDYDQEADKIYVAPNGTFGGKGTKDAPYDLDTALGFIQRGQTIVLMDGVYYRDAKIDIPETKTGTSVAGMAMVADEGAEPIIDLQRKVGGLTLQGSYWTIRGIDFRHSADNQRAFQHSGNFCLIEDCKFYDNGDTGIQLSRSNGAYTSIKDWPHNNIFKNIEVWNSADPSGINADGIGVKLTVGNGNKCIGCVSHHNLDDGWDLYTKAGTGPIGVVVLEDCVSYCQGYKLERDGSTATSFWSNTAGHNGLKMGGENIAVQHVVRNCKIFMNGNSGISSNSNPCMTVRDSVSFKNKGGNVSLYSDNEEAYNYDLKGVVSYKGGGSDKIANYVAKDYNYINGKNASGEEVTDEFFKSVDPNSVLTNGRLAQDAEGNFITGDFLELTDAVKAKIASVEGYEDPIVETTTEEVWTPDKDDDDDSNKGGGSAKRSSKVVDKEDKEDSTEKASEKETAEEESEKSSEDVTEGETSEAEKEENKENSNEEEKVVDFKDMKDNWAKPYVEALVKAGVVNGVTETEFAPNAKITRGDFTKMLVTALGLTTEDKHGFADVNESDYYSAEIAAAKAFGLVSGTSEVTFGPKNSITRQDAMTIMARAIDSLKLNAEGEAGDLSQFSDANAIAGYAKDAVAKLVGLGVINGADGKVNPTDNITRAETAKLIYDIMAMATSEK